MVQGSVFDVAVDIREGSPTYGEWFGIELSEHNNQQLFIPRGCAHGFYVTSREGAKFQYKCDNYYNKDSENGIILIFYLTPIIFLIALKCTNAIRSIASSVKRNSHSSLLSMKKFSLKTVGHLVFLRI